MFDPPWIQSALTITVTVVTVVIFSVVVVYPPFLNHGMPSRKIAKAKSDLAMITGAIDQFQLDCDRLPRTIEGIDAVVDQPPGEAKWKGPYLQRIPWDPWGHRYIYTKDGRTTYTVKSYGADGKPGGDGYDADIVDGNG